MAADLLSASNTKVALRLIGLSFASAMGDSGPSQPSAKDLVHEASFTTLSAYISTSSTTAVPIH